eukprot:TRINITY_DN4272_c0_g1_i3.p3 TRINITY_DN4272_c0_g1~~TRINITY_DN4272_c0_g1_i3.p3  ORF type:complete len:101 (+),score=11.85 TRINITY_DN4272_c0_g1_i3:972-1274(+)
MKEESAPIAAMTEQAGAIGRPRIVKSAMAGRSTTVEQLRNVADQLQAPHPPRRPLCVVLVAAVASIEEEDALVAALTDQVGAISLAQIAKSAMAASIPAE